MSEQGNSTTRKKKMLLMHMGGTIGMVLSKNGKTLEPPVNDDEYRDAIEPVTNHFLKLHSDIELLYECLSTADSNDITLEHNEEQAAYIRAREHEIDSIEESHGTDTMATTLAQLSHAYLDSENLNSKPDLVTPITLFGAQASIHSKPQDAEKNTFNALLAGEEACRDDYYPGIRQVFGSRIHDAAHVKKAHESHDDAFDVVDAQGILGSCSSSSGVKFNHTFYANVAALSAQERKAILDFRIAAGLPPLKSGRFMICPYETRTKIIEVDGEKVFSTETIPLEQGGYIHRVSASTLGHPSSLALQARDPKCLGIIFELTGIGNAPSGYLDAIREAVSKFDLPVYGTLAISGGRASTHEYAAGARFGEAGVIVGLDASPDYKTTTMTWLMANAGKGLTARALMNKLRVGFHEMWLPNRRRTTEMPEISEAYGKATGDNIFADRWAEAISLVEAYRRFKGPNLRWLKVSDPELARRVGALLPKPREELILPQHQNLDFAKLTGWTPPAIEEKCPQPLSAAVPSVQESRNIGPWIPRTIVEAREELAEGRISSVELTEHFLSQVNPIIVPESIVTFDEETKIRKKAREFFLATRGSESGVEAYIQKEIRLLTILKKDPELAHIAAMPDEEKQKLMDTDRAFSVSYTTFGVMESPFFLKRALRVARGLRGVALNA